MGLKILIEVYSQAYVYSEILIIQKHWKWNNTAVPACYSFVYPTWFIIISTLPDINRYIVV